MRLLSGIQLPEKNAGEPSAAVQLRDRGPQEQRNAAGLEKAVIIAGKSSVMIPLFRNRDDVGAGLLQPSRHDHAEIPAAENENLSAGEAVPEIQKLLGLPGGENTGGTRPGYRERADAALAAAGGKDQPVKTQFRQSRAGRQDGTTVRGDGKNRRLRQQTDTGVLQP